MKQMILYKLKHLIQVGIVGCICHQAITKLHTQQKHEPFVHETDVAALY